MRERQGRDRSRLGGWNPRLQMTPMIDVVFQLLIFFVITLAPVDLYSRLETKAGRTQPKPAPRDEFITIDISPFGYRVEGRRMTLAGVRTWLTELASIRKDTPVALVCAGDSEHAMLVDVLDICADLKLDRIAVGSR